MSFPTRRLLLIAFVAFFASACATNPVTGRREFTLMSAEREAALGAQAAEQVAQQIGLVEDPALVAYTESIGERLAVHSPRKDVTYRFAVADMPEPNAFALPGGYIYVSRGLLAITNNEDELANVIGHEIGHVAARHSAQRETQSLGVGLLSVIGAVVAGVTVGGEAAEAVAQVGQVAGAGLIASYGRNQERESDKVGQDLAIAAGWDPHGMATFMDTLGEYGELMSGGPRRPTFLDSHPMTDERVANAIAYADRLGRAPKPPTESERAAFLARFDGLLVGADPGQGVFRDALFLHPGFAIAMRFPQGWKTINTPAAVAAQTPMGNAMVLLEGQGATGDPAEAARAFAQANGVTLQGGEAGTLGGWPAYRARAAARTQQGDLGLDLTWVAHPDLMLRVMGLTSTAKFDAYAATFDESAESLRKLTGSERNSIHELRLRVVRSRSGETLAALSRRTGNAWSLEETAVANQRDANARLPSGAAVKIAVEVPYRGDGS